MSHGIMKTVVLAGVLLAGWGTAQQGKTDKLADAQMLARLLPIQWLGMNLLTDRDWSRQQIAQMEVAVATAAYTSKDFAREGSFEIVDALHSPMHLNEFAYQRDSTPPENLITWRGPWGEGYVAQDPGEDETRARLLVRNRWYIKVSVSPQMDSPALRTALDAWLAEEKVKSLLK
jgi:hypothetical protein